MRNSAYLASLRKAGKRPAAPIWIIYDEWPEKHWAALACDDRTLVVLAGDKIDRLDLRCIVGLEVTLYVGKYDSDGMRLFERLQDYAKRIVCLCPDLDEDIGWIWDGEVRPICS